MKKTSALAVAAGVVGSLVSGLIGYSLRVSGLRQADASVRPASAAAMKPIVKTITTTQRIHRKPRVHRSSAPVASVHYVTAPGVGPGPAPVVRTGGSPSGGDDSHESGDD